MALITTNGRSGRRPFTMLATRSIAVASSTEVPPNFMTITSAPGAPNERRFYRGHRQTTHLRLLGRCCGRWSGGPPSQDVAGRPSRQVALHLEEFGVQQGRTRRTADRVVREHRELVIQNAARTQTSNRHRHSVAAVYVKAGLRTVGRIVIDERLRRCERQLKLLRSG